MIPESPSPVSDDQEHGHQESEMTVTVVSNPLRW